jgi:hypothetical protein
MAVPGIFFEVDRTTIIMATISCPGKLYEPEKRSISKDIEFNFTLPLLLRL